MQITLTQFCKNNPQIPSRLIRAIVKRLGGWDQFHDTARDVTRHGAGAGFSGFIYYRETREFCAKYRRDILPMLRDMAESIGTDPLTLLQGFNCLGEDYSLDCIGRALYGPVAKAYCVILNALAWSALEETCRAYTDQAGE